MQHFEPDSLRVGYVVKRYPRYSETFIVNEILAHEAAGVEIDIFSLRPPVDTHFQDVIARVRAGVTYLPHRSVRASEFWSVLTEAGAILPGFWETLGTADREEPDTVYQAVLLAMEVKRRNISHLHAHFASSPTAVASLAARLAGVPFTFTAHAKDIFHESVVPAELEARLSEAAATVTVSDYNVAYLQSEYGLAASGVKRIYNGMDLTRFAYAAPLERERKIVAVGRLVEKKGFDQLIDACALLVSRGVDFQCEIIGAGDLEADLRAQIVRLGLTGQVELKGPRPQGEIIDEIQSAAVFAAPCVEAQDGNRDGLPTVLLEAMALGTPCVSTPVTGIPEVVLDRETGLMVPQRDPRALATAVEYLLDQPELGVQVAERARALIEERFDIVKNTAEQRSLFQGAHALAEVA